MSIPFVGDILSVTNLNISAYPIPKISYQWTRDSLSISGATGTTYEISNDDVGSILGVELLISNPYGYLSEILQYNETQGVIILPEFIQEPFVFSKIIPPRELNTVYAVVDGFIIGNPIPSVTYQWYRDGSPISGANENSYTPTVDDISTILSVIVTATNFGGSATASAVLNDPIERADLTGSYINIVSPVFAGYYAETSTDIYGFDSISFEWKANTGDGFFTFSNDLDRTLIEEEYIGSFVKCIVTAEREEKDTLIIESNIVTVEETFDYTIGSYAPQGVLIPGAGYDSEYVEKSDVKITNTPDLFANESHPIFRLGHPDVNYMDASGFTLDMYAFHGSGVQNVVLTCNGGDSATAGFVQEGGNTGQGYFYFPVDASNFTAGATYELRATAIPVNGYPRSQQMILTYYGEENKVSINTSTSIKEACLSITTAPDYDPTKKNIIELTENGYYDFGSNIAGSFPTDYGIIEVVPAEGVLPKFDLTNQTKNGQNITRPSIKQIKFNNCYFENTVGTPGVYVEDSYSFRWWFHGCTMQGNQVDSGNYLLPCGEVSGPEGWFRNSYYQRLYYTDCYAEQCHNAPFAGAVLANRCTAKFNYQDSYTNTVACINCSSINHLTPGCSDFHADHYQLFSSRSPYLVENFLLYGYRGEDNTLTVQPFGFFGTGNETYRDIGFINSSWGGSYGSYAVSQIGLTYDHVLFIGVNLENRSLLFVNRPGNAVGPVLVRGVNCGGSLNCNFLHDLDYRDLLGTTNEFKVENNTPNLRFTASPSDDSALNLYYEWHISGASMASVEVFNAYLQDPDGTNTNLFIGNTAHVIPTDEYESISDIFNSNISGRFSYSNFNWPENVYIRSFTLVNTFDENASLDIQNRELYMRLIVDAGTSTSLAGKKRGNDKLVDFGGFSPGVFDSINLTKDDIVNSSTGVTFQILSPIPYGSTDTAPEFLTFLGGTPDIISPGITAYVIDYDSSGTAPITTSFQWYSGETPVGTNDDYYVAQQSDLSNELSCEITITNKSGYTQDTVEFGIVRE